MLNIEQRQILNQFIESSSPYNVYKKIKADEIVNLENNEEDINLDISLTEFNFMEEANSEVETDNNYVPLENAARFKCLCLK